MEYPYNFLIITHNCSHEKCKKSIPILNSFGRDLQKENIIDKYQVIRINYETEIPEIREMYPYLHLMVKSFPFIFFFNAQGLRKLMAGETVDKKDIKYYSGSLIPFSISPKLNIWIPENKDEGKEITFVNLLAWVYGIKCVNSK